MHARGGTSPSGPALLAAEELEKMQKLEEMSRNEKGQQLKIEHLQETARNHHAALVAMKKQCQQLKADKESAVNELEELKARYTDTTQATQLLKDKMKLYAGDDGVDMDDLEQALTIVKRKVEGVPAHRSCSRLLGHRGRAQLRAHQHIRGPPPIRRPRTRQ